MAKSTQGLQELFQQISAGALKEATTQNVAKPQEITPDLLEAQKAQNITEAQSSVESQIANTSAKMQEVGIDPDKFGDTRNPIEKLLNLKPKQNWLFDIFEVLQRPQQAIFRGINEIQTGGSDVMGEALKGLTGQGDIIFGGELLRNAGAGDNIITDIAGFALDVFADPADLAFLPAAPFMNTAQGLSKAASKLDNIYDTAKLAANGISKFEKIEDNVSYLQKSIKKVSEVMDTSKVAEVSYESASKLKRTRRNLQTAIVATKGDEVVDTVKKAGDSIQEGLKRIPENKQQGYIESLGKNFRLVKDSETMVSPTDLVMRSLWGTAKSGLGITDDVLELASKSFGVGDHYGQLKKYVSTTFAPNKVYTDIINNVRKVFGEESTWSEIANATFKQLDDKITKYAEANQLDFDAAQRMLSIDYVKVRGKKAKRSVSSILNSDVIFPYTDAIYNDLQKAIVVPPGKNIKDILPVVTYKVDGKEMNWIRMRDIKKEMLTTGSSAMRKQITIPNLLSKEDLLELDEFRKMPNYDSFTKDIYNQLDEFYKKSSRMLGSEIGLDGDMSGYLRNAITEEYRIQKFIEYLDGNGQSVGYRPRDVFIGDPKVFKSKKYPAVSVEANLWATADAIDAQMAKNQNYIIEHMNIGSESNVVNEAIKTTKFPANKDLKYHVVGLAKDLIEEDQDVYLRMLNQNMQVKVQGRNVPKETYKMFSWNTADGVTRRGTKLKNIMEPEEFNALVDFAASEPEKATKLLGEEGVAQLKTKLKIKEPIQNLVESKSKVASPVTTPETVVKKADPKIESKADEYRKAANEAKKELRRISGLQGEDLKEFTKAIFKGEITDPVAVKAYDDWQFAVKTRDEFTATMGEATTPKKTSKGVQKVTDKYQENVRLAKKEVRDLTGTQGKGINEVRHKVAIGEIKDPQIVEAVKKYEDAIKMRAEYSKTAPQTLMTTPVEETAFEDINKYIDVEAPKEEALVLDVKKAEKPLEIKSKTSSVAPKNVSESATITKNIDVQYGASDIIQRGMAINRKEQDLVKILTDDLKNVSEFKTRLSNYSKAYNREFSDLIAHPDASEKAKKVYQELLDMKDLDKKLTAKALSESKPKKTKSMAMAINEVPDELVISEKDMPKASKEDLIKYGYARDEVKSVEKTLDKLKAQLTDAKFSNYIDAEDFGKKYTDVVDSGILMKTSAKDLAELTGVAKEYAVLNNKYIKELENRAKLLKEYGVKSSNELPSYSKKALEEELNRLATQEEKAKQITEVIDQAKVEAMVKAADETTVKRAAPTDADYKEMLSNNQIPKTTIKKVEELKKERDAAEQALKNLGFTRSGVTDAVAKLKKNKAVFDKTPEVKDAVDKVRLSRNAYFTARNNAVKKVWKVEDTKNLEKVIKGDSLQTKVKDIAEKSQEELDLLATRESLNEQISLAKERVLEKSPLTKDQTWTQKQAEIKASVSQELKAEVDKIKELASQRKNVNAALDVFKPKKEVKPFVEQTPQAIDSMKPKALETYINKEIKNTSETATKVRESLDGIETEIEKLVDKTLEFDQADRNIKKFLNQIDRDTASPEVQKLLRQYDELGNFEINLRMRNAAENVQQKTRRKGGEEFGSRRTVFAKKRKYSSVEEMATPEKRNYDFIKNNIETRMEAMAKRIEVQDKDKVMEIMDVLQNKNVDAQSLDKIRKYKNLEKQFKGTLKGTSKYGQIAEELKVLKTDLLRSLKVKNTTELNKIITSLPEKIDKYLYKDVTKLIDDYAIFKEMQEPQSVMPEIVDRFTRKAERTLNDPFKFGMESTDAALLLNARTYETDLAGKVVRSKTSYADMFKDGRAITMEEALTLADGDEAMATQYFNVFKRNQQGPIEAYMGKTDLDKNLDVYRQTGVISPTEQAKIGSRIQTPESTKKLAEISAMKKKIEEEITTRMNKGVDVKPVQTDLPMTGAVRRFEEAKQMKSLSQQEMLDILKKGEYEGSQKITAMIQEYRKLTNELGEILGLESQKSLDLMESFQNFGASSEKAQKFGELTPTGEIQKAQRLAKAKEIEKGLIQLTPEERHIMNVFQDVAGTMQTYGAKKISRLDAHLDKYSYIKKIFKDLQFDEYLRVADDIAKNPQEIEKIVSEFTTLKYANPEKMYDYVSYLSERTMTGARIVGNLNETLAKGVNPQELIKAAKEGAPLKVLEGRKAGTLAGKKLTSPKENVKLLGAPDTMKINKPVTEGAQAAPKVGEQITEATTPKQIDYQDVIKRISSKDFDRSTSFLDLETKSITLGEFDDLKAQLIENGVPAKTVERLTYTQLSDFLDEVQKGLFQDLDTMQSNSIEYLNGFKNKKVFEESFSRQVGDWISVFGREVKDARVYQETFNQLTKSSFGNQIDLNDENSLIRWIPDRAREIEKAKTGIFHTFLEPSATPVGYVSLKNGKALVNKIEYANSLVNDPTLQKVANQITNVLENMKDGRLVIEANTARLLTLDYTKGANELTKFANMANDLFKRNKLLSPAFNIRNVVGVATNMWLSGMSVREIGYFFGEAHKAFQEADRLISLRAALSEVDWSLHLQKNANDAKVWRSLETYMQGQFKLPKSLKDTLVKGLDGTGSQLQDIQSFIKPLALEGKADPAKINIINKASLVNGWGNETIDAYGRMAVLMKAMDGEAGQKYMKNLSIDNDPIAAVRLSMFDPKNLTVNEMEVVKKFVPFYTFTKMNLAYHMANIPENAVRYHRMYKATTSAWSAAGIDINDVDDYKLEQMYIPLPGINENGKYYAIKANFPQSDVAEFVSNPLGKGLAMVTPLVRAPFEYATGTSIFTGNKLENFKGERSASLPFLSKKSEYLLSQTGADVPLRSAYGLVKAGSGNIVEGVGQFTNMISQGNTGSTRISKQYEKLEDLQAGVSQLKQQGIILPEITVQSKQNSNPKLEQVNVALEALLRMKGVKR